MRFHRLVLAALAGLAAPAPLAARTLCTLVTDAANGAVLREEGDCRTRVTPASTFKIPLAVIGFEAGVLTDAHMPVFDFKPGYPDWGGPAWHAPTDPTRWLAYSVVWYSQIVAHRLGRAKLQAETARLGFGNADFSGDPGQDNGLDRAWIMSSLKVSPTEQVAFLRRLATRTLPVSAHTLDETLKIVTMSPAGDGWTLHGVPAQGRRRFRRGPRLWLVCRLGGEGRPDPGVRSPRSGRGQTAGPRRHAGPGGIHGRLAGARAVPGVSLILPLNREKLLPDTFCVRPRRRFWLALASKIEIRS